MDDADINLGKAALLLARAEMTEIHAERYERHLQKLCDQTEDAFENFKEREGNTAKACLDAISYVLRDTHDYKGDSETYDDLQNANLIRVIERRKGLPISLCILSLHVGRAQGWTLNGLALPGHFLCRIEHGGEHLIFDPFDNFKALDAKDIRALIKRTAGINAELAAQYFEPATNRDILIRLLNNIKFRQIEEEDYAGGLLSVQLSQIIDPDEYRLYLEAGVLYARVEQNKAAIDALELYLMHAQDEQDKYEASMLLQDLRLSLH